MQMGRIINFVTEPLLHVDASLHEPAHFFVDMLVFDNDAVHSNWVVHTEHGTLGHHGHK